MKLTRRRFLWTAAGVGGASLVVGWTVFGDDPPLPPSTPGGLMPNAFLELAPDNVIRFHCPRDEMGQGVTTGLTTLIGEELDVAPAALRVELAAVHPAYRNPVFRVQATGASTSMRAHFLPLRQAAADVRQLLLNAAAHDLSVTATDLRTEDGHVITRDGERFAYGRFIATAATLELPSNTRLKPRAQWKYIGRPFARLDGVAKATGTAQFGIDVDIPDLHRAVVRRAPVAGGTLRSMDATTARAMPGVVHVSAIGSGVVVVARRFWQAKKAAEALDVEWDLPAALAGVDTARIKADYKAALTADGGSTTAERGDPEEGFAAASHVVEAEYWTPYLAHAPMEPMNAVVRIQPDRVDVWSGTQSPAGARGLVARTLDVPVERVHMHSTWLGGGFGRRGALGHVVEAAEAAAASGKPVQVVWTREDDIRRGLYRPASLMRIRAGVAADGTLTAWDATRVGANITPDMVGVALPGVLPALPDSLVEVAVGTVDKVTRDWIVAGSSVEGLHGDYDVANRRVRHVTRDHGLPVLFWRSVGHSYTAFAKESAIDALAHASRLDPVELRLRNTRGNPRLAEVIRIAGERMQAMREAPGRGLGLAAHGSFESYVAQVAEVSVDGGAIRVHRVLCVIDCGLAVNPDVVRAQMEGSVVYGLSAALHGNLEVENGAIRESNFHDYPIVRMHEAPDVEVIIVDSDEPPTGVGEPGVPPVAPAVANAVFAATGQRLTSLPLKLV